MQSIQTSSNEELGYDRPSSSLIFGPISRWDGCNKEKGGDECLSFVDPRRGSEKPGSPDRVLRPTSSGVGTGYLKRAKWLSGRIYGASPARICWQRTRSGGIQCLPSISLVLDRCVKLEDADPWEFTWVRIPEWVGHVKEICGRDLSQVWDSSPPRSPPSVAHRCSMCIPVCKGKVVQEPGLSGAAMCFGFCGPVSGCVMLGTEAAQPGREASWDRQRHVSKEQIVFIHESAWISRCSLEFALSNWQHKMKWA